MSLDYYQFRAWLVENWNTPVGSNGLGSACPLAIFLFHKTREQYMIVGSEYFSTRDFNGHQLPAWAIAFEREAAKANTGMEMITGKTGFEIFERVNNTPPITITS